MVPGLQSLSYEERLRRLDLWTLEERRNRADLIEVFKIYKGYSTVKFEEMFETDRNHRTRGHSVKLNKHQTRLDLWKYFFSECVVQRWNRPSQKAVDSRTVNGFKSCLRQMREAKKGFFTDGWRLQAYRAIPNLVWPDQVWYQIWYKNQSAHIQVYRVTYMEP